MFRRPIGGGAACAVALLATLGCWGDAGANLITEGGFEAGTTTLSLPDALAVWGGDRAALVPSTSGITPAEGAQMLQFINTSWPQPGASSATSSDMWQLVDAVPLRGRDLLLKASFNRVDLDEQTDTRFALNLYAFAGLPANFDNGDPNLPSNIGHATYQLLSDADPATWETVSVVLSVPVDADYLGVAVSAAENIRNDTSGTELDGHFADAVELGVDCNGNGVFDAAEIAGHPSLDWNGDGVIDNCQQGMGVVGAVPGIPGGEPIALHGASPNPFNPGTTIAFDLTRDGLVALEVFDVRGRPVRRLLAAELTAGRHEVEWNGRDDDGNGVASGTYFARLTGAGEVSTRKMLLLK